MVGTFLLPLQSDPRIGDFTPGIFRRRTFRETSPNLPQGGWTRTPTKQFTQTNMSLINLSFSNLETTQLLQTLLAERHLAIAREISVTYFGGLFVCMYALVFFVYGAGIAIIGLLSIMYEENKRKLQTLQRFLDKQDTKIEALEKELAKQKLDTQTMYNTLVYDSDDRERTLRGHGQQLTDHANHLLRISNDVQTNTVTAANHSDLLRRLIHHLQEQHTVVQKHTQLIQKITEDVSNCSAHIDAVDETLNDYMDQGSDPERRDKSPDEL